MKNLRDALNLFVESSRLGGRTDKPSSYDREQLRRDLSRVEKGNEKYFRICVAMVIAIFCIACGVALYYVGNPSAIRSAFAALGIGFYGITAQMSKLWKAKVATGLALALASSLDEGAARSALAVLLKKIQA